MTNSQKSSKTDSNCVLESHLAHTHNNHIVRSRVVVDARETMPRLDVIKWTVIWFHCQRYGASICARFLLILWNTVVINVQAIHSFDTTIYDHIVNIDQLVVTTWTCDIDSPAQQITGRMVESCVVKVVDPARSNFACILLWIPERKKNNAHNIHRVWFVLLIRLYLWMSSSRSPKYPYW